jgi:hypothetical protein
VPLKSTGHRKTGTGPEEVEEKPTSTVRAQEQQQRFFFSVLLSVRGKIRQKNSRKEKANKNQ